MKNGHLCPGLPETNVDAASVYEDVSNVDANTDCVTIISISPAAAAAAAATKPPRPPLSPPVDLNTSTSNTLERSEASSSDRGSFTINSIVRAHGERCNCGDANRYHDQLKQVTAFIDESIF